MMEHLNWELEIQDWRHLWHSNPWDELSAGFLPPALGTKLSDDAAMFLAMVVSLRGVGRVSPNPLVGAVVLDRNGALIGFGAHQELGGPHAEVHALAAVQSEFGSLGNLADGTIFVTLEPCAHYGRTPPCAEMLAKLPLKRVVIAQIDPNPLVSGCGVDVLVKAHKIVEMLSSWTPLAQTLLRVFRTNQIRNQVYTAMKVASTPSGVVAGHNSQRLWITNQRSRALGHFLRVFYDAIIVGYQTFKLDNPELTPRSSLMPGRTPLRVLLDPRAVAFLECPRAHMLTNEPEKTLVIMPTRDLAAMTSDQQVAKIHGVQIAHLELTATGHFEWRDIKTLLWSLGIRSLLIEGGAGLYHSAQQSRAVDMIHWFVGSDVTDLTPEVGLLWEIPSELKQLYTDGAGLVLDSDRYIEFDYSTIKT